MDQLVFIHYWVSEPESGTSYTPFSYESKDQFIFDMLEKYKDEVWTYYGTNKREYSDYDTSSVEVLGHHISKGELNELEHNIVTLQEWFNREEFQIIK